jgi:hypothetical protein
MFFMERNFACSKVENEFLDRLLFPYLSLNETPDRLTVTKENHSFLLVC